MVDGATKRVSIGSEDCRVDPHVANNIKVTDSQNVSICEMSVDNNMMLTGNTGRIMVRDNTVCQNIRIVRNDLLAIHVMRNSYAMHLVTSPNTVVPGKEFIANNVAIEHKGCRAGIA